MKNVGKKIKDQILNKKDDSGQKANTASGETRLKFLASKTIFSSGFDARA